MAQQADDAFEKWWAEKQKFKMFPAGMRHSLWKAFAGGWDAREAERDAK